jgi:ATP-dependent Lhr-like helicase
MPAVPGAAAVEHLARTLLRRYGVVFWRLLTQEASWLPPWRDLRVYRRLEARGEIRGGRFVAGFLASNTRCRSGRSLRKTRRQPGWANGLASGADPLNRRNTDAGAWLAALTGNRLICRDGVLFAVLSGGKV